MRTAVFLILGPLLAGAAFAQQPVPYNGRVVLRAAQPDLQRAVEAIVKNQVEPAWLGYAVAVTNDGENVRNDGWSERCRLEQTNRDGLNAGGPSGPIRLEPSPTAMVLFRLNNRAIEKIRTYSSDCQIDAGGLTLYWLDGVNPSQSVAFLKTFVTDTTSRDESEPALAAIALQVDPSAAVALLDLARNSTSACIRQRGLFFIARRAGSDAASTITQAIDQDPDVNVQKQAVAALSRLPKSEGIPLLINLARSNKNPAVRRQAMIVLGQSNDPRALSFFEEVLR